MSATSASVTFTDRTASTSTSTPSPTSSQSDSDTATLYLFTFLATILILVLLSASLVLRSYILRRRYRQRFHQALADGLLVDLDRSAFNGAGQFGPLAGFGRPTRRLGPKPVLWDNWIHGHPADKDSGTWASITPVAVWHTSPPQPSTLIPSPQPSIVPPSSPASPQVQPHSSFLSRLRFPSPFSPTSPSSSPLPGQAHNSIGSPLGASTRSPSAPQTPPDNTEKGATTLAVCVLVAMPDASTPVHCRAPDRKGKSVDPLESLAHQRNGDADPPLPSPLHQPSPRTPNFPPEEEGLPLLQFGVVETRTGDWVWNT